MSSSRAANASRHVASAAAAFAIAGGLTSFLGWATDIYRLTDWLNGGIRIKANPAIAITLGGLALLLLIYRPSAKWPVRVLGGLVEAIGAMTLSRHLLGWDLGIDQLLFEEPAGAMATAAPGRMGPPASVSLAVLGIALVMMSFGRRARVGVAVALAVLGIGTLSLMGYAFGAELMYTLPRLTGISLQTALMLVALSVGIIAARPDLEPMQTLCEDSTAGILARRVIAAGIVVPVLLGWLRVQGQRAGLYDYVFGATLHTIAQIGILLGVLWWCIRAVRERDLQRHRAEAERESGQHRLQLVLDASAVPFAVLLPVRDGGTITDFRLAYLNPAAARALERDIADLQGRNVAEALPATWQEPGLFEKYVSVATDQGSLEFELHSHARANGAWYQVIASPLDDSVAVWFANVNERKHQELALRDADRRKDEFLATLAHELRNPLAPIRQASIIAMNPDISDEQRRWCNEVIERQVKHMALLLDDLLDVARITRGALQLRRQPTRVGTFLESAIEASRPLIEKKEHELHVEMDDGEARFDVDPLRMSQVVSNMLNNAAKYTNPGGVITVSGRVHGRDLVLQVTDNGIGMAPGQLGRIFDMFSQVNPREDRSDGGLGIGLALSRGLVELHGGSMGARSAGLGTGSMFTVILPRTLVVGGPADDVPSRLPVPMRKRRILLADDNRDAVETLATLLRADGHEVTVIHDGEAALSAFAGFRPDTALLDIGMPRLTGYEVARRIRQTGAPILMIAITGWGQDADRTKSLAAGFDHHLTKPVAYEVLSGLLMGSGADVGRREGGRRAS